MTPARQRQNCAAACEVAQIQAEVDRRKDPAHLAARAKTALLSEIGRQPIHAEVEAGIDQHRDNQDG